MGHKLRPLLAGLANFDFGEMSLPDISHNMSNVTKQLLRLMVGRGSGGLFQNWKDDAKHRAECQLHGVFPEVWDGNDGPLPWRLDEAAMREVDRRTLALVYPHYCEVVSSRTQSFWRKSSVMWKMKHKMLILTVLLPTLLRGYVTPLHQSICKMAEALRYLDGQTFSRSEALALGIEPGSRAGMCVCVCVCRQMHVCVGKCARV
jgi:hypothetical protein